MFERLAVIRNVSKFERLTPGELAQFPRLTLIYGENGRGKSTLSAIFRSFSSGDPGPILARRRLGIGEDPHVVLGCERGQSAIFENGNWSFQGERIRVFDDAFVEENVYAGLSVGSSQRQNLHRVVIGPRGVRLARQIDEVVDELSRLQAGIREAANAFSAEELGGMSVDEFVALEPEEELNGRLAEARQVLSAISDADSVSRKPEFSVPSLPEIGRFAVEERIAVTVEGLEAQTLRRVEEHFEKVAGLGEKWVRAGYASVAKEGFSDCPFCGQELGGSDLFRHYGQYFSAEYLGHVGAIEALIRETTTAFSGDRLAEATRAVGTQLELANFWRAHLDIPECDFDLEAFQAAWKAAREGILAALSQKRANPLEGLTLSPELEGVLAEFERARSSILEALDRLASCNELVRGLKVKTAEAGDRSEVERRLHRLERMAQRFSDAGSEKASAYEEARSLKVNAERRKEELRAELDGLREIEFPGFEMSLNGWLARFGTGFRIRDLTARNPQGRTSSQYEIEVLNHRVPLSVNEAAPSFGTALSAGDRTTLAFALFLASIQRDPDVDQQVVVIDDPISSLDDHRTSVTAQAVAELAGQLKRTVVLSHSKRLLCSISDQWRGEQAKALEVRRNGDGSDLALWQVSDEAKSDYDRRHRELREYVTNGPGQQQLAVVAQNLRPIMEGFFRVAAPEHFTPSSKIGQFAVRVRESLGTGAPILPEADSRELDQLLNVVQRFHHDTNPAYQATLGQLQDAEVRSYGERVLRLTSLRR